MLSSVQYLGAHPEINELMIVVGKESSPALIADCCRIAEFRKLTICYRHPSIKEDFEETIGWFRLDEPQNWPAEVEEIEYNELKKYKRSHPFFAVLFDSLHELQDIFHIAEIEPDYLLGTINRREISAFSIWEQFRKSARHIYLQSYAPGLRDEILNWDYRESSSIELSVIFPVYNVSKYLDKCIESILQWDADYVEYIFVDDGSPDDSASIISNYAERDSRVKLLQKENGGCASARQFGMERAQGNYIGFIDPDDYIDPTMLKKLFIRALAGSYEISYCGYKEVYEATGEIKEVEDVLGWPYNEGTEDRKYIDELIAYRRIAIWRAIYKKDLIDRNGIHFYTDLRRFDDLPFKVETFAKAQSVVCIPEYLYYYRMMRPGQDVSADDERLYVHFQIFKYLDQFIQKTKDRHQITMLQIVKIQTHQWALEKMKKEFIPEYVRMARDDLLSNMTALESEEIAREYTSRRNALYNFAICHNMIWLIRWLVSNPRARNRKLERQMLKISELAELRF